MRISDWSSDVCSSDRISQRMTLIRWRRTFRTRMSRTRGGSQRQPSQRQLRVGEEVRHALVRILGRGDLRDPELSETKITVTEVRLSPDLRNDTRSEESCVGKECVSKGRTRWAA